MIPRKCCMRVGRESPDEAKWDLGSSSKINRIRTSVYFCARDSFAHWLATLAMFGRDLAAH